MVSPKLTNVFVALATAAFLAFATNPASALTADLAKKCRELMIKAHPPLPAGSSIGSAKEGQEYFRTCVARGGKMDDVETSTEGRGK